VPQVVVADVALHPRVVRAVHRHAAVLRPPDAAPPQVAPFHAPGHVPVEGVARHPPLLPHQVQLHPLHVRLPRAHHHDVPAEAVRRGVVPADGHVAGEQPHLGALVQRAPAVALERAPVRVAERLLQHHRLAVHRLHHGLLGLQRVEVGGRDGDAVSGAPVGGALQHQLRGALRGGLRQPRPPPPAPRRGSPACRPAPPAPWSPSPSRPAPGRSPSA
jgi:hypothetical protein